MPSLFNFNFRALGGPNELQIYAQDQSAANFAAEKAIEIVRDIEEKYSRYRGDSVISKINAAAGDAPVDVDEETAALLDYGAALHKQSNGLFDLTSGVLRKAWNFTEKKIPNRAELNPLLDLVGWKNVGWNRPAIKLEKRGMELDFGGIGKEYAVDRACSVLLDLKIESALVNLGGDLRVIGSRPDGLPWIIGIANPRNPRNALLCVELRGGALATSGDYERFFEIDGVRYSHILNPRDGMPVSSFQSVSVFSESCLVAGSASTLAMLLGEKRGKKYLAELNVPHVVITQAGAVEISKGIARSSDNTRAYAQFISAEK